MHPPLLRPHPQCQNVIDAFQRCAAEQTFFQRMLGSCNDAKIALDQCFRAEKEFTRKQNLAKARRLNEKWRKKKAELAGKKL